MTMPPTEDEPSGDDEVQGARPVRRARDDALGPLDDALVSGAFSDELDAELELDDSPEPNDAVPDPVLAPGAPLVPAVLTRSDPDVAGTAGQVDVVPGFSGGEQVHARHDDQRLGAWHTLARALRPRATRAQVLAGVLCGLLGFAVVAQVRQTHGTGLSTLRQSELVGILDQTTRQGDDLQTEARQLERTRQELESGSTSRQAAVDAATRSAATQGILTGRLPAEGPGVVVSLTEPDGAIRALTLLNVLEELRNAGAEAIQLNDLRLTASTSFVSGDAGVVVDGTALHAPYTWLVIGDPSTMSTALDIPGGALASVRNDGGRGVVTSQTLVEVSATRILSAPTHAALVAPGGS